MDSCFVPHVGTHNVLVYCFVPLLIKSLLHNKKFFTKGFGVMIEHSTSVYQTVGAKVMVSIPYVAEIIFQSHLFSNII